MLLYISVHMFSTTTMFSHSSMICVLSMLLYTVAYWVANMLHDTSKEIMSIHKLSTTST